MFFHPMSQTDVFVYFFMYISVCSFSLFLIHYCAFWYSLVLQKLDVPHVLNNCLEYLTTRHHFSILPLIHMLHVCFQCACNIVLLDLILFLWLYRKTMHLNWFVCDQTFCSFWLLWLLHFLFCIVTAVVLIILNCENPSQAQQNNPGLRRLEIKNLGVWCRPIMCVYVYMNEYEKLRLSPLFLSDPSPIIANACQ